MTSMRSSKVPSIGLTAVEGTGAGSRDELVELLAASARGDERAFADLYDQTSSRVYGMVLRVIRDAGAGRRGHAGLYLEVWRQSARSTRVSSAVHALAADDRPPPRGGPGAFGPVGRGPGQQVRRTEHRAALRQRERAGALSLEAQRVRKVLDDLTEAQREAVSLAYFGGYTHSEVAELLHIPLGTVKTRIRTVSSG